MEYLAASLIRLLADGALVLIVVLAGVLVLRETGLGPRLWRKMPLVVMAGLTSLFVGKLLSLLYQPAVARPFIELGVEPGAAYIDNPGFPSDHMLLATAVVLAAIVLAPRRRVWWWILIALTVLMGAARVAAYVHTPLDVVGGALAGLVGGLWYLQRR